MAKKIGVRVMLVRVGGVTFTIYDSRFPVYIYFKLSAEFALAGAVIQMMLAS